MALGLILVVGLTACGAAEPILKSAVESPSAHTSKKPDKDITPTGPPKKYSSCAKLNKVYPHGVARSSKAADVQVANGYEAPTYNKLAQKVYAKNKANLDRDDDGTACQQ